MASVRTTFDRRQTDAERIVLINALYRLLESLPQASHLHEVGTVLCQTIIDSTENLRYVWLGVRHQAGAPVLPLAVAGDDAQDCDDWSLPESCFDFSAAYSQASLESVAAPADFPSLFAPWRSNPDSCSANAALALPLRAEHVGASAMIVFYAADIDYFAQLGVAPFQAFCNVAELLLKQSNMVLHLSRKVQLDGLTGLMTRRKTVFALNKAMEHADLVNQPLSIMLCRVEGFDKLNDIYGWFDADSILAAFVQTIALQLPADLQAGRWTGVEFLYLMPDVDAEAIAAKADALGRLLRGQTISVKNWSIRLTVSIGVATHSAQNNGLDDLIFQARQVMQKPQP